MDFGVLDSEAEEKKRGEAAGIDGWTGDAREGGRHLPE